MRIEIVRIGRFIFVCLSLDGRLLALAITAVGLRSVGFGATHFSLDKSRMGGDTFQPKNPTFLKPTVIGSPFLFRIQNPSSLNSYEHVLFTSDLHSDWNKN